jgi:hypothetical protein
MLDLIGMTWNRQYPENMMSLIGTEIAKMHMADIIHGDLTTSNMMLRHTPSQSAFSGQNSYTAELVHTPSSCFLRKIDTNTLSILRSS